jgi:glycosyltransferase involved in cell wall biosynthesis
VVADAGVLVDERDSQRWTAAIEQLLEDERLRRELADRGIARVNEKFTWPVVARAHLRFFEELL